MRCSDMMEVGICSVVPAVSSPIVITHWDHRHRERDEPLDIRVERTMANVGSDDRLPHLDIIQTMGTTLSTSPQLPPPTWSLSDLQEELLSTVVGFLPPRDVEALTVASKTVAYDVLPRYPIWKHLFIYRWNMWNYALERDGPTESVLLEIDDRLKELVPSCSESRLYQLLAHAVTPVPSFADVRQTERGQYFSHHDHAIDAIGNPLRRRTLDIAYTGSQVGGDRCVRANTPFMPTFRVAVYAISNPHKRRLYRVGLVASGYFEITIRANPHQRSRGRMGRLEQIWRHMNSDNMTSIGLATSSFPLIDRQPGWDRESIGYHGDDGHFFHQNSRGRRFSTPFSVGDTVGCGLRRDLHSGRSFVYFTNNGDVIPHGEMGYECNHSSWYPIVGLDCHDIIHFNFGQEPFACAAAVDTLFDECNGQQDLLTSHLSWYNISESDAESSEDESLRSASSSILGTDSDADSEMGYDRLSDISELAMYMNRVVEQEDQFGNEGMDEFGAELDETS